MNNNYRIRGFKKIIDFEFCFTMEMYWKYRFSVWINGLKRLHEKILSRESLIPA